MLAGRVPVPCHREPRPAAIPGDGPAPLESGFLRTARQDSWLGAAGRSQKSAGRDGSWPVRQASPREPGQLRDLRADALRLLPLRVRARPVRPRRGMRRRRLPVVPAQTARSPAARQPRRKPRLTAAITPTRASHQQHLPLPRDYAPPPPGAARAWQSALASGTAPVQGRTRSGHGESAVILPGSPVSRCITAARATS
jgi:hypothetical protein